MGVTTARIAPEVRSIVRALGPPPSRGPLCGVEHEFRVRHGTDVVDFRTVIHSLPIPGHRLDPTDPHAYRCGWGGALTADGREAEIATPPVRLAPGFASAVVALTDRGRRCVGEALPDGHRLEGYSTHINVSVSERRSLTAARLFATRFAPALMLLLDGPESPGLLVRPRPGRLELGGEYRSGDRLRAAILLATGGALACASPLVRRRLPPAVVVDIASAVERYGLYVDRRAFGADLYVRGRACPLRIARGGRFARHSWTRTAQQQLDECWGIARSAVRRYATRQDLLLVDDLVAGRLPLPIESSSRDGTG